jgi:hypothetical protein
MTVFEQVYQLVGSTEVDMYKMSVIEHISLDVIHKEGDEMNYFLLYFIDSDKTLQRQPCPTPCEEAPEGGVCSSIKTMALEGETAPSWWGCLCACV